MQRKRKPTRPQCYGQGSVTFLLIPGHALHKGFIETKRRRSTGRQPGTKSASRPGYKPVINRGSTGYRVPPSVYIGILLFVLLGSH